MGLTNSSTGLSALNEQTVCKLKTENSKIIAIAGNPNVGKSTLFNGLTGMNQHTGNWAGKTVASAWGLCKTKKHSYMLVDIPGTYSLMAHSPEEELARNFICFENPDAVVVVCDATVLERNLNLVLQITEICKNVIVCVNLLDQAKHRNIEIDLNTLSSCLGVPVVGTVARKKHSLKAVLDVLDNTVDLKFKGGPARVKYSTPIEMAIAVLQPALEEHTKGVINSRWLALKLIENDPSLISEIKKFLKEDLLCDNEISTCLENAKEILNQAKISPEAFENEVVSCVISAAGEICKKSVRYKDSSYNQTDRKIDKILTGKRFGYPIMFILLLFVFWLTINGANYPSNLLSQLFGFIEGGLSSCFKYLNAPNWLHSILVLGLYRTVSWVVAVMLPPMAIFFPLFTLLEDSGYLPRIAYNLDKPFKRCNACGKQALTMCMGFGCNAAGVVGCRIIDSPRERLLAVLTNSFVPCNGRFPSIILIITMFFVTGSGFVNSVFSALILTLVILTGIFATFAATKLLSNTFLKGVPSSYTLELPSYRPPQVGRIIIRSVFDRTLFVLGRSVAVAAPAGMLIWLFANVKIQGLSLLFHISQFLDPFACLLGLDGVILIAFILGFPANEIVFPIIIMAYTSSATLTELAAPNAVKQLLLSNGWTPVTAVCFMIFLLMHWPCSTTLLTIKKETGSLKWTALSAILPTAISIILCLIINLISKLII